MAHLEYTSHSPAQTQQIGFHLGARLAAGDVVCLSGELGAGKTTLAGGLARGFGALDPVTSPTFVLVNEYQRSDGLRLWHLDCYRLESAAEALAIGLDDLLDGPGAVLIEWPERILSALPAQRLDLSLTWAGESERQLRLQPRGLRYEELLSSLQAAQDVSGPQPPAPAP